MRDEMLRAKVLIFMIPLVLPIGQPAATATGPAESDLAVRPVSQTLAIPADDVPEPIAVQDLSE